MFKHAKIFIAVALGAFLSLSAASAKDKTYGLGRTATPEEIAGWDIDVRPDGQGLPKGSGNALQGEEVFAEKCAVCHGDFGEGVDNYPVLAGGQGTLLSNQPVKTVGSYWPYVSTVWDYIYRAMPFGDAQSLSPDEVYAVTAYILNMNDIIEDDFDLNQDNLADIKMPNVENFYMDDRKKENKKYRKACMKNCAKEVVIESWAKNIDVTPEDEQE